MDTRKAVALLAYLAVRAGPQSRDLLVDLLRPTRTPIALARRSGARSPRCARPSGSAGSRSAARRWGSTPAGSGRRGRFRGLVAGAGDGPGAIAPLSAAVALDRDDLLAGFGLRDSVDFDDWQR